VGFCGWEGDEVGIEGRKMISPLTPASPPIGSCEGGEGQTRQVE